MYSRTTAFITVFLLIAVVGLAGVELVNLVGTTLDHGYTAVGNDGITHQVEHSAGVIKTLKPDNSFLLTEANGQVQSFQCSKKCLTELSHIQRHITEKAHTDIYFIRTSNNVLDAIDVD